MSISKKASIHADRVRLQNPYAHLGGDGDYDAILPSAQENLHRSRYNLQNPYAYMDDEEFGEDVGGRDTNRYPRAAKLITPDRLHPKRRKQKAYSKFAIAKIARQLQLELWKNRKTFWNFQDDSDPITLLDPTKALGVMGYTVDIFESLGQYRDGSETFEVAGVLDNERSHISISRRFPPETRLFTLAHELGHAILHDGTGLHRDRAVDNASSRQTRPQVEIEADMFAAYFLMPEKQIRIAFERRYLLAPFELTDATAFALAAAPLHSFESEAASQRTLARTLASAEQYNGVRFDSLAKLFGVSVEAMAIRLEELGLVTISP